MPDFDGMASSPAESYRIYSGGFDPPTLAGPSTVGVLDEGAPSLQEQIHAETRNLLYKVKALTMRQERELERLRDRVAAQEARLAWQGQKLAELRAHGPR